MRDIRVIIKNNSLKCFSNSVKLENWSQEDIPFEVVDFFKIRIKQFLLYLYTSPYM